MQQSDKKTLEKISTFIEKHHLLSLATFHKQSPQVANLFFAYDALNVSFIVASDAETEHIQNILQNSHVAGSVALETETIAKIEGIQFKATMQKVEITEEKERYFSRFPYARAMTPTLWKIIINEMKYTNNSLGFGKKLFWNRI